MKYFKVKYTDKIAEKFGGETWGPLIKIRPKYVSDTGLIEHEKTHVRQWYAVLALGLLLGTMLMLLVSPSLWPVLGVAPVLHQLLYQWVRPYRRWCEVQAYRKQISVGGYSSTTFAVTALVEKYGLGLSVNEAEVLLSD